MKKIKLKNIYGTEITMEQQRQGSKVKVTWFFPPIAEARRWTKESHWLTIDEANKYYKKLTTVRDFKEVK